jgi:pyruvate/2-oxoglutarate dehydrogenase complex dihydrolipoamide acyltransferase (E2) component
MIQRVLVPQAFENMEEATLGAWRKREGDAVSLGDALCELITEKTTFDLPAEIEGTILHIAAPEKSILPVHAILALAGPPDTSSDELQTAIEAAARDNQTLLQKRAAPAADEEPALAVPSLSASTSVQPASTSGASGAPSSSGGTRIRATPAARRAAREAGVDLEEVARKVGNKVVSEEDVRAFAAA